MTEHQRPPPQPPPKKKHRFLKIFGAFVGVIVLIIIIATIFSGGGGQPAPQGGGTEPASAPEAGPAKVGQWWEYDDGLAVSVAKLNERKISEVASGGHPGEPMAVVTLKVRNGSDHNLNLYDVLLVVRAGPQGNEAEEVFDEGIDGFTEGGTLIPGDTATAKYGFAVDEKHLDNLTIEVSPSFDYGAAIFKGGVE